MCSTSVNAGVMQDSAANGDCEPSTAVSFVGRNSDYHCLFKSTAGEL